MRYTPLVGDGFTVGRGRCHLILAIPCVMKGVRRARAIRPTVLSGTPRASSAMGPTGIWNVLPRNPYWKAARKSFRRISVSAPANDLSIRPSTSLRGRVLSKAANTAVKRAPNASSSCFCAQLAQIRSRRTTSTPCGIFVGRARELMSAITVGFKVQPTRAPRNGDNVTPLWVMAM
jgi:hypothetical protein